MKSRAAITLLACLQGVIGFEWVRAGYEKVSDANFVSPAWRKPWGFTKQPAIEFSSRSWPSMYSRRFHWVPRIPSG